MSDAEHKWCYAWVNGSAEAGAAMRGAIALPHKWEANATIGISFLDGEPALREKVAAYAKEWIAGNGLKLRFSFRSDTSETPIRISFAHKGSWSAIGTSCRSIAPGKPTMNFGWLAGASEEEAHRVILHEFGHALGLIHEHQNPAGGIKWNTDNVYRDLSGPPNNWDKATIDNNMFTTLFSGETSNHTAVDPKSIMMYPIPARWLTAGEPVGLNAELSQTDKDFIKKQYS